MGRNFVVTALALLTVVSAAEVKGSEIVVGPAPTVVHAGGCQPACVKPIACSCQKKACATQLRWLVVGRQYTWVPICEARARGLVPASPIAVTTVPAPVVHYGQQWVGGSVYPPYFFQSSTLPASGVSCTSGLGGGLASGVVGFTPIQSFAPVGNAVLPASPYQPHSSYGIYSEGAFTHSTSSLAGGFSSSRGPVPAYSTEIFRGTRGMVSTTTVPRWAQY